MIWIPAFRGYDELDVLALTIKLQQFQSRVLYPPSCLT